MRNLRLPASLTDTAMAVFRRRAERSIAYPTEVDQQAIVYCGNAVGRRATLAAGIH
jgi:hypothetical protein